MRSGTRAFEAVPWREDLTLDNVEFDVAWRLIFGGVTTEMAQRIDRPPRGFNWRGERMEWAFAQAVSTCFPAGTVVTGEKPAPELRPPAGPEVGDKADVDIVTKKTGKRFVYDVRTVNVQCNAGIQNYTSAAKHCAAIEKLKCNHYAKFYRNFAPFVVTVTGAVTHASAKALLRLAREVGKGYSQALDWEPAHWVNNALHRIAIEMIKTIAIVATREVLPPWRPISQVREARERNQRPAMCSSIVPCDMMPNDRCS